MGLKKIEKMAESHTQRVDWQPDNGSRYDMLYGEYLDSRGVPMFFVTWLRIGGSGGTTLSWSGGGLLHHSYISEKMKVNEADAAGILAYLKIQGHEISMPEGFNDMGRWAPKPQALEE
jgi:hypothetical protein